MSLVYGVDVSGYQRRVDWRRAVHSGVLFAICKATQGRKLVSEGLTFHLPEAREAGAFVSVYHFADHKGYGALTTKEKMADAKVQAEHFFRTTESFTGMFTPWVDLELVKYNSRAAMWADLGVWFSKFPGKEVIEWSMTFNDRVKELSGVRPGVYTLRSYWRDRLKKTDLLRDAGSLLWLAEPHKPGRSSLEDQIPKPLGKWAPSFWQYDVDPAGIPGYAHTIDRDVFIGSVEELRALLIQGGQV